LEAWYPRLRATRALVVTSQLSPPDLPRGHAYTLKPPHPTGGSHNLLRLPIASCGGTGILTSFPSTTRFRLVLGADSPCADERCAGNLGLTATGLFTLFIATHVSIRTSDTSSRPYDPPSQAYGTLSYQRMHSLQSTHSLASVLSDDATFAKAWPRPRAKAALTLRRTQSEPRPSSSRMN
jgi:hypothetical protein